MATKIENEEKKNITGLDTATYPKDAEYDLVKSLLEAADFKASDDNITEAEISRNKKFLFSVHLHPLSDTDARLARKKATVYMPNPNGKKYPPIEKEFDTTVFNSWLIYLATTEEDQQKIWGNREVMAKFGLVQPVESIDILLKAGEKRELVDLVTQISGLDESDEDGETVDIENFQ